MGCLLFTTLVCLNCYTPRQLSCQRADKGKPRREPGLGLPCLLYMACQAFLWKAVEFRVAQNLINTEVLDSASRNSE